MTRTLRAAYKSGFGIDARIGTTSSPEVLVAENVAIYFRKDNYKGMAKKFGKSVASSGHAQLRGMLAYKSPISGACYIEVDAKFSTLTCSVCRALSGPRGLSGLAERQWTCADCGSSHDREVNAALNTVMAIVPRGLCPGITSEIL